jgi:pyrimidine operon attenuation protein/uracil phosphoribosyltransferase
MPDVVLMDAAAVEKAVVRIAHEIREKNAGVLSDLLLIGILKRGDVLGRRIAAAMARQDRFGATPVPAGSLDITLYRDDIGTKPAIPRPTDLPGSVDGRIVVLVDDVLFTGRSVRAAMDALVDFGRPAAIQLAVLVDRGHRELPIRPDYVGKNVPTAEAANVRVELTETDGRDRVVLEMSS